MIYGHVVFAMLKTYKQTKTNRLHHGKGSDLNFSQFKSRQ